MIRTREQILQDIESNIALKAKFESFHEDRKKEFLDFCTGERGVKILYDSFFNAVMNPDIYPERIRHLIGSILGKDIVSFRVMQRSSFSIGDDKSLVIMDIVVELAGGEIINLEVQKIGYDFPGERAACYASDLTIRQYARARNEASLNPDKVFSYRSIHPVYTIVLIEKTGKEFSGFPDKYIHRFAQQSDSGLRMSLVHHYIFIALDIFKKTHQNGIMESELEAWLMFLSTEDPEQIMNLCDRYPDFEALYRHIYEICRNTEDVMGFFSEALLEMDRNTVQYMIDVRNKENEELKKEKEALLSQHEKLQSKTIELESRKEELESRKEELESRKEELESQKAELQSHNEELQSHNEELQSHNEELQSHNEELQSHNEELQSQNRELLAKLNVLEKQLIAQGELIRKLQEKI